MTRVLISILIASLVTIIIRFAPFVLFRKKTPKIIEQLGSILPYSIMAMLVVYCLKDTNILGGNHGIPEIISSLLVIISYKLRHNTLLSIVLGTIAYMILLNI